MPPAPHRLLPGTLLAICAMVLLIASSAWQLQAGPDAAGTASRHLSQAAWQYTEAPDYSPPPSALDSSRLPPAWQALALPSALPNPATATGRDDIVVDWVRIPVAQPPAGADLALYSARIKVEGTVAVYINGKLTQRAQLHGQLWDSLFTPLWIPLEQDADAEPVHEILVRMEHSTHSRAALSSLWLGSADALRGRYYMRLWLQRELPATLNAAFLLVGVFSLAVWLWRRREIEYLLFFTLAATSFAGHQHYYLSQPIVEGWFAWLTSNALFWIVTVLHLFMHRLHGRPLTWLTRIVVGVTVAGTVLSLPGVELLPVFPSTSPLVPLMYAVVVVLAAVVGVAGALCSWRRSREGLLLASTLGIGTLVGIPDWLMHNNVISVEGWFTGAYTNAITFFMIGALMYRRYVQAIRDVEDINASLEQRLQKREAELQAIHLQLREAGYRQTISDERQRLMQDMHDGLGSSLINAIRSVDRADVGSDKIAQILKDCLDDLKLTIDSMEPVEADLLLLLASLRFRLEPRLESAGIRLLWEVRDLPALPWLEPSSGLHILRILQESIANILRHTRATEIRVGTAQDAGGVCVTIADNGQGFDVERALNATAGRGLRNQQRRALAINGRIAWDSAPGGTLFTLWLPLTR